LTDSFIRAEVFRRYHTLGDPVNFVDPAGLTTFSISLNLNGWLGAFGGGGGPSINFGYDKKAGFSFSITVTAGGGAATGFGGALGVRFGVTNAATVDQLLGTAVESSRGVGPIEFTGIAGKGYKGGELGLAIGRRVVISPVASGMLTTTSALIQWQRNRGLELLKSASGGCP